MEIGYVKVGFGRKHRRSIAACCTYTASDTNNRVDMKCVKIVLLWGILHEKCMSILEQ